VVKSGSVYHSISIVKANDSDMFLDLSFQRDKFQGREGGSHQATKEEFDV
jgi:hypothetical protein